jgi:hypothetical protein
VSAGWALVVKCRVADQRLVSGCRFNLRAGLQTRLGPTPDNPPDQGRAGDDHRKGQGEEGQGRQRAHRDDHLPGLGERPATDPSQSLDDDCDHGWPEPQEHRLDRGGASIPDVDR